MFDRNLEYAYNEWAALPMPTLNQNHIFDRPKPQLEDEAIRGQISWVARKWGLTFKQLDNYIEKKSNGTVTNTRATPGATKRLVR